MFAVGLSVCRSVALTRQLSTDREGEGRRAVSAQPRLGMPVKMQSCNARYVWILKTKNCSALRVPSRPQRVRRNIGSQSRLVSFNAGRCPWSQGVEWSPVDWSCGASGHAPHQLSIHSQQRLGSVDSARSNEEKHGEFPEQSTQDWSPSRTTTAEGGAVG